MSLSKDEYQERTVVENGNVVTYAIPHGRIEPEIVSMHSVTEEKFYKQKQAEQQKAIDKANKDAEEQKEKDKETAQKTLAAESAEKDKAKAAAAKKN